MIRRKADDEGGPTSACGLEQGIGRGWRIGSVSGQGGEVVGEDVGAAIVGVAFTGDAQVAGAQVARGVVGRSGTVVGGFLLALPRALGTVGGNQDPFFGQGVQAAMRMVAGVEHVVSCTERSLNAARRTLFLRDG